MINTYTLPRSRSDEIKQALRLCLIDGDLLMPTIEFLDICSWLAVGIVL